MDDFNPYWKRFGSADEDMWLLMGWDK